MKHVIIGTAGHIDHGKTTLIRAITGRNTDRLKEEQERGISIELGFTYFDLPSGQRAGIIDVPGHEKFIKNMLAGVIGIDIVLLVVSADEGIMPQTMEHLYILDLLGIKKGFVVLTKSDLVDSEWIDMVEEEVREEIKGTFLENSPIVRASATTKMGIEEIIHLIDERAEELEERNTGDMPRLPVDRVFSISGFGTVVTGTLLSGQLKVGDEVEIFPSNKKARIRTLQVHDQDATIAYGGQRVAVNLAGLKKEDVERGDTIAPINSMSDSMMVDVKVKLLKNIDRYIENRTRLRLYIGTKEVLCRIVLLDKEEIGPGEEAYAQLRLEEEIVSKRGDKFIIRFYSPMFTIGGGEILEPNPKKKKRFDDKAIKELEIKEMGSATDIIENIIEEKSKEFPTTKEIAIFTAMLEENLKIEINKLIEDKRVISFPLTKDLHIIHVNYFNKLKNQILEELNKFHSKYPLRAGMPKEEIRSRFLSNAKPKVAEAFIELLVENDYLKQRFENISIKEFEIKFNHDQLKISKEILKKFNETPFQPPRKEDLATLIHGNKEELDEIFLSLLNKGDIIKLNEEVYISKEAYDLSLDKLKEHFENKTSISIGEYRDMLNTNRKIALAILEHFDQVKITKRDNDIRILNKWQMHKYRGERMEKKILILDSDKSFVKGLKYSLEQDGYIIDMIFNGKDILEKLKINNYDLILLDLILPDSNGLNVCQAIRNVSQVPIIVITEKDEDINKILALEYGADDYIVKPFNILELKARIKAILRRVDYKAMEFNNQVIKIQDFTINTVGRKVIIKDRNVNLTGKEFDLFFILISNPNKVFRREELLELVWGYAYYGDLRTVDVHIRRIREKIEKDSSEAEYIMTKWGVGYYFNGSKL